MSGVLLVIHDTTGKQRIEAVRRDFVANVSHELKTPVSGITLLADTIITGLETDPSQAKAFARKLKRETDRLAQLVRDLLDLSQLEAEKMRPVSTQISLSDVALKAVTEQTEAAASAGISLRTEFEADLPKITGSEEQLELLVRNLIDNGIKYTPKGGDILLSTKGSGEFVALIIKDTGIGIPQSDQKRIFERFYRVDKNRSRETGGTGLGLSIVKHVVENHNGQVKVESTVGLGSKFTILLPATQPNL
jgi:signal transduction histidine kinase